MLAPGGITRRIRSFGWSWWTPWMMKCIRRPIGWSGSQWKTLRWSQYSDSVQMKRPREDEQHGLAGTGAAVDAEHDEADDHRDEDDRRHGRVDPREEVEEPRLEERRRGAQAGCSLRATSLRIVGDLDGEFFARFA